MTAQPEQPELAPLLSATAKGDRQAFHTLYRFTAPRLLGLCLKLLFDRDQAEDVLQDTWIRIWHRAGDYHEQRGTPLTWMMSIARHLCLDLLRAQKRENGTMAEEDELQVGPLTLNEQLDTLTLLSQHLNELSDQQRECVLHVYYRGLTHAELATHMDMPLGTVKSWVRRGMQNLQQSLRVEALPGIAKCPGIP